MRSLVRRRDLVVSLHADEEMQEDDLDIDDVEACILGGQIVDGQRDRESWERKYLIRGEGVDGREMFVVAKVGPTSKVVVITVFLA